MSVVLYDLVGRDDRRFSPNCWRTRLALAHKGLTVEVRPTRFTEIRGIADSEQKTLPVIDDGGRVVGDSWAIAQYLEDAYPDRPSLFGGAGGRQLTLFFQNWTNAVLHAGAISLVVLDIHDHLLPEDQAYFRSTREQRFGRTLEEVQSGRETRLEAFRQSLAPLRATVQTQPFLGGETPLYADYLAFSPFQWARSISPFKLLADDDPLAAWVGRCLDLYDGLGRSVPAYY